MQRNSRLPARAGVGLRTCHYDAVLAAPGAVAWFEVHAENYMGDGGPPHHYLERIRRDHAISFHGVGLSIGSAGTLDPAHLTRLARLSRRYQPAMVSEHLAWSSHGGEFLSDLLPLPYDDATLDRVCAHVDQLQDTLARRVLIENPSSYVAFRGNSMSEGEFLTALCRRTGCGLLLDVNNVHVSAVNHGRDPYADLAELPVRAAGEIHLAGHAVEVDDAQRVLLIDTHDRAVCPAVWALYAHALTLTGPLPTLIEWDQQVPAWPLLLAEAQRADAQLGAHYPEPAHARAV